MTERQQSILSAIVEQYAEVASPVGSSLLAKVFNVSSATIRAEMAELERHGFITQPHTSAGRIPTDKGYRFYVDSLMDVEHLSEPERNSVSKNLLQNPKETILRDASKLLSAISRQQRSHRQGAAA